MKNKRIFYTELAYFAGILLLALGTAMMERSDFGVSMIVAPAYVIYLKVSQSLDFFTFGMAEYALQALLLVIMSLILRSFKLSYLGSFITAVFYGFVLDTMMYLLSLVPGSNIPWRVFYYLGGIIVCAIGICFLFHTYLSPEAYELLVKELVSKYGWKLSKVKTIYDCTSCAVAIVLSFLFFGFGHFEGVKLGTILCALVNGSVIGICNKFIESRFDFKDRLCKN